MRQTQNQAIALADRLERQIDQLYASYRAEELDRDTFLTLAAGVIAAANAAAVALADAGLAGELGRRLGLTERAIGSGPDDVTIDETRIRSSLERVLDADIDAPINDDIEESRRSRLGQAVRGEPLITTTNSVQRGMQQRDGVLGWVRMTDRDPCPKCLDWADGVVRSVYAPMRRHNGCACIQQPVLA